MYFNGAPQDLTQSTLDFSTGILTLPVPFYTSRVLEFSIDAVGLNFVPGDVLSAVGGTGTEVAEWQVTSVDTEGTIAGLQLMATGSYTVIPGTTSVALTGGSGTGAQVNIFWSPVPVITVDFTYYFRCRFVDDSYSFENFMFQLWQLKKLTFITVRP